MKTMLFNVYCYVQVMTWLDGQADISNIICYREENHVKCKSMNRNVVVITQQRYSLPVS